MSTAPLTEYSWLDTARWMAPDEKARDADGVYRDRDWWVDKYVQRLKQVEDEYEPDGIMLLENQVMDSTKFGRRFMLPFGGKSTRPTLPDHPFSIDGTASGTVCVVGVHHFKKEANG